MFGGFGVFVARANGLTYGYFQSCALVSQDVRTKVARTFCIVLCLCLFVVKCFAGRRQACCSVNMWYPALVMSEEPFA
jgi:hypothetical protein